MLGDVNPLRDPLHVFQMPPHQTVSSAIIELFEVDADASTDDWAGGAPLVCDEDVRS